MVVSPDKFKPQIFLKTFYNLLFQMSPLQKIPSSARIIYRKLTKQRPSANLQAKEKLTFVLGFMTTSPNNGS